MKFLAFALACLALAPAARASRLLETTTPTTRTSAARVYREMPDETGTQRETLVVDTRLPGPTHVRIDLDQPLLFQWVLNDQGKVVQTSNPYYAAHILSIPDSAGLKPEDKKRLLEGTFYFTISDLSPSRVVSSTFTADLPPGGHKPILPLAWDSYNPKGTWGYSIEEALGQPYNTFLLDSPPADMKDFCPKYSSLNRAHKVHFWQALVTKVSELESSYVPYCASDEGKYNPGAKGVISSGLVQISLLSIKASCYQSRGCSEIRSREDLYDPAKNLHCGLAVMSCLVTRGSCLSCKTAEGAWTGIAAYWSTLRDPYEVPCSTCPSGHARVGFKPEIQASLKSSAAYCF
jgi:hypothetical protein